MPVAPADGVPAPAQQECPVPISCAFFSASREGAESLIAVTIAPSERMALVDDSSARRAHEPACPYAVFLAPERTVLHAGWVGTAARLRSFSEACQRPELRRWFRTGLQVPLPQEPIQANSWNTAVYSTSS